jgi:hypothetical protein
VDAILSQDLANLDSYSDEDQKQLLELVIRFTIDSKVDPDRSFIVSMLTYVHRVRNSNQKWPRLLSQQGYSIAPSFA